MEDHLDETDLMIEKEAGRLERENGDSKQSNEGAGTVEKSVQQEQAKPVADDKAQQQQNNNQQQSEQKTEVPDLNKFLEEISGGLFKSQDEFKLALPKIQSVDTLEQQVAKFQKELADNQFADDYERKRNELKRGGATKEQLKAYEEINDLGDLSKLDPIEAKVKKLVLVDGYPENVARKKVEREFPLDTAEEEDLDELKADLDISVKKDLEALQAFKVAQSTAPTDKSLVEAQAVQQIEAELTPVLTEFVDKFSSFGKLNLNGEEGDKAITFDLDIDTASKQTMAADIKAFFVQNKIPVTQENYNEALSYARANYLDAKLAELGKNIWKQAETHFTKALSDKYSNKDGLLNQDKKTGAGTLDPAMKEFKNELLGGPLQ
jgi:hypothetical protein